ncbi:hypothetical protein [Salinimicrobium sp. GXAS 041]|uniref:hypothetical protein n=1 Tax=Salinimicrobium sp. GXAS 041 TaxID=3400806 RepID=UPI003C7594C0
MKITLPENTIFKTGEKPAEAYKKLQKLIHSLNERALPEEVIVAINTELEQLEKATGTKKQLLVLLHNTQQSILELVRKKTGLVPENYYTYLWLPVGMAAFGLPIGSIISSLTGNTVFLAIGLPIGMSLGLLLGKHLDERAKKENKVI